MLFFQTIEPATLELLKVFMQTAAFSHLRLVGGTALALQIGHRSSIDIDLFGKYDLDDIETDNIMSAFEHVQLIKKTANIRIYSVNNIKVDIVNYPYTWLDEVLTYKDIRLASKKDIAAMKLSAITGRGTKKDFIDLFFLLKEFSLNEMLSFYKLKYPQGSEFLVLKSLSYFDDADQEESPRMLEIIDWDEIKTKLMSVLGSYIKSL